MNEKNENEADVQTVKEAVQEAAEQSDSIRDEVRNITLQALSQGQLDIEKIKQVTREVMEGATLGAEARGARVKESLSEAVAGLDEALTTSVEASKLALEEVAGGVEQFGKQDLKRALDELLLLEDMFLDTIKSVAAASDDLVRQILDDLVQHARNSGTGVGRRSADVVERVNRSVGVTLREGVAVGSHAALNVGSRLSLAAAGFLEGLAGSLAEKAAACSHEKKG